MKYSLMLFILIQKLNYQLIGFLLLIFELFNK